MLSLSLECKRGTILLSFLPIFLFAQTDPGAQANASWLPVTESERLMKNPTVEKDVGAEAIFWHTYLWDEFREPDLRRTYSHYARIKVFDEKGKEQVSTVNLVSFRKNTSFTSISGRTIKPNGTIVEMSRDAVKDKDILNTGGLRVRGKTFTLPSVEPGDIIEYRYREISWNEPMMYLRGQFQHEIPVQKLTFHVRPLPMDNTTYRMSMRPFNCSPAKVQHDNLGFSFTSLENVPAYHEEPFMPASPNVRPWGLFYYSNKDRTDANKYWQQEGREVYGQLKVAMKVNAEIKAAAAKAVGAAESDEDKVVALIQYLRTEMRDLWGAKVTDAERGKILKSMPKQRRRNSAEVFASGIGTPDELNTLFAAMATSVGLDARPALVGNRDDLYFHESLADSYFLSNIDMAVKTKDGWRLYDVSTRELPPHMVGWREEGTMALVSDPKTPQFIQSFTSPASASLSKRVGKFKLSAEGTLEGDVHLYYSGHRAVDRRRGLEGKSSDKQIADYTDDVQRLHPGGEVSEVKMENTDDPLKPLAYHYHIKLPNYAQRTGKRLFFRPLFFQSKATPLFPNSERRHDIHIPYGWKEQDEVTIEMPEDYELENPQAPSGLEMGKPGGYRVQFGLLAGREFHAQRELVFGDNGMLLFKRSAYPQLKRVFDEVHKNDTSTLALRQKGSK